MSSASIVAKGTPTVLGTSSVMGRRDSVSSLLYVHATKGASAIGSARGVVAKSPVVATLIVSAIVRVSKVDAPRHHRAPSRKTATRAESVRVARAPTYASQVDVPVPRHVMLGPVVVRNQPNVRVILTALGVGYVTWGVVMSLASTTRSVRRVLPVPKMDIVAGPVAAQMHPSVDRKRFALKDAVCRIAAGRMPGNQVCNDGGSAMSPTVALQTSIVWMIALCGWRLRQSVSEQYRLSGPRVCGENGRCAEGPICLVNAHCDAGRICDEEQERCIDSCAGDDDCDGGLVCGDGGLCEEPAVCEADDACLGDRVCIDGRCDEPCIDNADCGGIRVCVDGRCPEADPCSFPEDCDEGRVCSGVNALMSVRWLPRIRNVTWTVSARNRCSAGMSIVSDTESANWKLSGSLPRRSGVRRRPSLRRKRALWRDRTVCDGDDCGADELCVNNECIPGCRREHIKGTAVR